jgi:hypothetical protein
MWAEPPPTPSRPWKEDRGTGRRSNQKVLRHGDRNFPAADLWRAEEAAAAVTFWQRVRIQRPVPQARPVSAEDPEQPPDPVWEKAPETALETGTVRAVDADEPGEAERDWAAEPA